MKRGREEDEYGGPLTKKRRTNDDNLNNNNNHNHNGYHNDHANNNDNNQSPRRETAAWGIDDDSDDSDEDDDVHHTNNGHTMHPSNGLGLGHDMNHNAMMSGSANPSSTNPSNGSYSGIGMKLMKGMGYKEGEALGKKEGGIKEPIQAFERISARGGLGFDNVISIKPQKHEYEAEKISIEIEPTWYKESAEDIQLLSYREFESYLSFKPRCDTVGIEWYEEFGSKEIQNLIFKHKSEFDPIGQTKQFMEGRNKANPFEGIKREIFQNRAALKMCEIDRHLNYLITQPYNGCCITFEKDCKIKQEKQLIDWKNGLIEDISIHHRSLWTRELLYFADLCSGPGGFTEYFLHINKWQCRGWGFTLKGNEDFKLNKFNSNAPWDNFTPEYGPKNNGDITCNENLIDFRKKVISVSMNGCHIVMADGGFDCFPNYNSQELLSRQLILCQFLCAMSILKKDGIFVCKLFDCFHPFTASIIYIAAMCFNEIALIKPNQSRPANSERYIICKGYKFGDHNIWDKKSRIVHEPHYIVKHLYDINMLINKQKEEKLEVDRLKERLDLMLNNNDNEQHEQKTNQSFDHIDELKEEIYSKESKLQEVCPLIPVDKMPKSFILWLRKFNEANGLRQVRHLKRIKKYLEDKTLKIDDQITIRQKAINYWFKTKNGEKFILLDPQFGCRYVTKYEDYNYNHQNNHDYSASYNNYRPLNTLISNKELLRRIEFEYDNCTSYITPNEFNNNSDFNRYNIRGDWFCIAFEHKENEDKYPPKWVTLISTGNRQIFECIRERDNGGLICISKTNDLMRLPADSVIDCIKQHSSKTNQEIYHIFDCWVIGSKSLYKRNFIQRQEFCRVLYQGYGSKYLKFAGAMPALQSIKRPAIQMKYQHIYLWFIRNKKSMEQKEKKNKHTAKPSQYWRPCAVKLWHGNDPKIIPFHQLLNNLKQINQRQMKMRNQQQMQMQHQKIQHHQYSNRNNNGYGY